MTPQKTLTLTSQTTTKKGFHYCCRADCGFILQYYEKSSKHDVCFVEREIEPCYDRYWL